MDHLYMSSYAPVTNLVRFLWLTRYFVGVCVASQCKWGTGVNN